MLLRKILRGLRYCSLKELIDREIEICSIETVESDVLAILGGDLPLESQLNKPEKRFIEVAIGKYGIIDITFSVSTRKLANCPLATTELLSELGFLEMNNTDKPDNSEDIDFSCLEILAEEVDKNEPIIKLFLQAKERPARLSLNIPKDYFPQQFVVMDACLTNSGFVWINKHFYL